MNLGDVKDIHFHNAEGKIDMMTWGFPCQDISVAGKLKGIEEGTRSGLYYEGIRILKETRPKISIIENVKNLTSKRFKDAFDMILQDLNDIGYNNYWKVLNAKNYGIPQNRERVFIVSIRKDVDNGKFEFPKPFESDKRLKDILEDQVNEKYFLSDKMIQGFIAHNQKHQQKGTGFIWNTRDIEKEASTIRANAALCPTDNTIKVTSGNIIEEGNLNNKGWYSSSNKVYSKNGIAPTITAMQGGNIKPKVMVERVGGIFDKEGKRHQAGSIYNKEGIAPAIDSMQGGYRQPMVNVINATKKGYDTAKVGDSINMSFPYSNKKRGRVGHGVAQTLDTTCRQATLVQSEPLSEKTNQEYRIRRLTPLECWRLMRI